MSRKLTPEHAARCNRQRDLREGPPDIEGPDRFRLVEHDGRFYEEIERGPSSCEYMRGIE